MRIAYRRFAKSSRGETLSSTSLIFSAWLALGPVKRTRRKASCSQLLDYSFARLKEEKWDVKDNIPPGRSQEKPRSLPIAQLPGSNGASACQPLYRRS